MTDEKKSAGGFFFFLFLLNFLVETMLKMFEDMAQTVKSFMFVMFCLFVPKNTGENAKFLWINKL